MQGPQDDEALRGMDGYEQMVNTFAENAKAYWRLWGPQGEPMIRVAARAMGRNLSRPTVLEGARYDPHPSGTRRCVNAFVQIRCLRGET